ncbi:TetR/AcrR family transcriptional regulator [Cupriavidus sp. CuC1]|uniref:TetR/AcrR family transcriptional regulator n=2 Tax=Cupriavidus TaxID=106589 RepID=UPI0037D2AB23
MRVTREKAAQNRDDVLNKASELFRARGPDGVGIADLMRSVGLTHGGFYAAFGSKAGLIAEASVRALEKNVEYWEQFNPASFAQEVPRRMAEYLDASFRDGPAHGCLVSALGPELSRQGEQTRHLVTEGVKQLLDVLEHRMPAKLFAQRRAQAIAAYAATVGALVLVRLVDDEALASEIRDAVANAMPSPQ